MLEISLLGAPQVTLNSAPVDINRRKALALLAYLVVTGQPHSRESLATLLWPDSDQSRAFAYLRTALWTLNNALGEDWIDTARDTVEITPGDALWLDVAHFRALVDAPPADDPAVCIETLAEAVALYHGDFMAGFTLPDCPAFDDWQFYQADSLRAALSGALEQLIACHRALGAFDDAIPYARRWLALDPLHEPAHRTLMQLFDRTGQRSAALRQYQVCAEALRDELGVEPEPETTALYEAIQAGRAPAPPVTAPPAPTTQSVPPRPRERSSPGSIPLQSTPFIARREELTEITALLNDPDCRLLTLLGQGGIGKTRLALKSAMETLDRYPDGVYFVPLAPLNAAEYIVPAIADVVELPAFREGDSRDRLLDYLREKRLLLVLDNFEHVLDGAGVISDLLTHAPGLTVLVTSRERLQLQEEWVYEIAGMRYPTNGTGERAVEDYDAVQLFLQSARRARPDFELTNDNQAAVVRICRLVEGMPLGVELAASWLNMLSPGEIAAEIERSLDFLSTSVRNLPERHRSLRAVFESAWERLTPQEQQALSRLSVFRGGFQQAGAEAVAGASLPLLRALVDKSLLRRDVFERYDIHELLRQFAEERLNRRAKDRARTHRQYTGHYAAFVRGQVAALKGHGQIEALKTLEAEIDNIRMAWMLAISERNLDAIRGLLSGLALFYLMSNRVNESREVFGGTAEHLATLDLSGEERIILAKVNVLHAQALRMLGERQHALRLYQEVLPVLREGDDALMLIGLATLSQWPVEDFATSRELCERALALCRAAGDRWGEALALHFLGEVEHHTIHYAAARPLFEQSLAISRAIGDRWGEGVTLNMLGEVAYTMGHYDEAARLHREALALSEEVGDRYNMIWNRTRLADVATIRGRYDEAEALVGDNLRLARQVGDRQQQAYVVFTRGDLAFGQGDYAEAERLYREALAMLKGTEASTGPAWLLIALSQLAVLQGDAETAEQLAREVPAHLDLASSPWAASAVEYCLGAAARLRGDRAAAWDHLRAALRLASEAQSIMLLVRYLIEGAWLLAGDVQPEDALELLALVLDHHATWDRDRTQARDAFEIMAAGLPPDAVTAAQQRGAARSLEGAVRALLEPGSDG